MHPCHLHAIGKRDCMRMAASDMVDALRRYLLAPGKGRAKTGRLWVYVLDGRPAGNPVAPVV